MQNTVNSRKRGLAIVCFSAIWIFLVSSVRILSAQQQDAVASVSGSVVDSRGAAVPNAAVVAQNQTTGAARQVNADNVGHFVVSGIPAGRYTLVVTAKGFGAATQKDVLASTEPAGITVALSVGSVSETVEVQAVAGDSIAGQHAL